MDGAGDQPGAISQIAGGVAVFKMDADGARLYNSQFLVQSDTGGQVALDPAFGLAVGGGAAKPLYTLGTDGKLTLNTDNATLYTDLTGNLHMKGDVTANNFYFNDGGNVKTLLSQAQKKISSDFLDVYGLTVTNKTTKKESFAIDNNGNVSMHSGSISWDAPVVEYQYSSNNASWHVDEMASDKYRRDSSDGGKTWSKGYQYKAEDGKNGSDANIPSYIKSTYIDGTSVTSPVIRGGKISGAKFTDLYDQYQLVMDYAPGTSGLSALNLMRGGSSSVFSIWEDGMGGMALRGQNMNPFLETWASGSSMKTVPYGTWDFSSAAVTGIVAQFG